LKLDLHGIYNEGEKIERALRAIIDEAVAKKAPLVEIIQGKGSGQLKKRVVRFLDRKAIKALYHCVERRTPTILVASSSTSAENNARI
jgi:DNA-nicking Smr family endonuclease